MQEKRILSRSSNKWGIFGTKHLCCSGGRDEAGEADRGRRAAQTKLGLEAMGRLKEASCREITWSDLVFIKGISEHFVESSRGGPGSHVRKLPQSFQVTDGSEWPWGWGEAGQLPNY